jgi:hypothetical protein
MTLNEAQALIVAMLEECGLSSVKICVDSRYNRYTKPAWNGGGGVHYMFTDLAQLADETRPAPVMVQRGMFDE